MKGNWLLITIISIVVLGAACIGLGSSRSNPVVETNLMKPTDDVDEIDAVIKKMYTNDYNQIYHSRSVLISISERSSENRNLVVKRLMAEESKLQGPLAKSVDYNCWEGLTLTLGSLKATEAIDVLTANIRRRGIIARMGILDSYPAATALVDIGEPALPAVRKLFLNLSADNFDRYLAVAVIAKIGDRKDRIFLKEQLKTEKDPHIRALLEDIARGELYPLKK